MINRANKYKQREVIILEKRKIIGICVAKMQDDTRQMHVRAICKNAKLRQYQVMVFNIFAQLDNMNSFAKGEARLLDMIPMEKLSVLVVFAESFLNMEVVNALVAKAQKHGIPVICVDRRVENCYNVLFAYEESFEKLVRHIVEYHGCKRINFMAGFENNEFSDARIDIFKKVLRENQIPFEKERLAYGQFWEMPARWNCEKWVSMWQEGSQEMPEAIICANDIMALTVCNVLTNHGIHVPEDILLTGFDGLGLEKYCTPRLTTACDDVALIGSEVLDMVDGCLDDMEEKPYDIRIPFQTKFTESCGCNTVHACNPNEQIMALYGRSAEMRIRSTDTFLMMTALTDGYSAVDMAEQLGRYQNMLAVDSMMLFISRNFYQDTDLPSEDFEQDSMMLLSRIKNGKYSVSFQEILPRSEYYKLEELFLETEQLLFVPIHWQEEIYGFMAVSYQDADKDLGAFYEFILGFEQVLGTIKKQSQLHQMYVTDMLTHLYNRRGFYNQIEKRIQELSGRDIMIFLASADMDGLKYINDTYGHAEGDYAIKTAACFLKDSVDGRDGICARFGGDEYIVAIVAEEKECDIGFYEAYEPLLQKRVEQFNQRSKKPYPIGVSVGSLYSRISTLADVERMMKEADDMMYHRKCEHHRSRSSQIQKTAEVSDGR